jgi:hypothetical protein
VLRHADGGDGVPAVAAVYPHADQRHLRVWPLTRTMLPTTLEFIARLGGDVASDEEAVARARAVLAGWRRPQFQAAGDYE